MSSPGVLTFILGAGLVAGSLADGFASAVLTSIGLGLIAVAWEVRR